MAQPSRSQAHNARTAHPSSVGRSAQSKHARDRQICASRGLTRGASPPPPSGHGDRDSPNPADQRQPIDRPGPPRSRVLFPIVYPLVVPLENALVVRIPPFQQIHRPESSGLVPRTQPASHPSPTSAASTRSRRHRSPPTRCGHRGDGWRCRSADMGGFGCHRQSQRRAAICGGLRTRWPRSHPGRGPRTAGGATPRS